MPTPCTGNTGNKGTKYTYAELEGLWIKAGGSKGAAPIAAAIALAESGGCSGDENPTDNGGTQTSWGLWQISDGTHNQPVPNILDPAINARAAVEKYNASGWSPWGTYDSGAYKAYMSGNTTPDMNVPGTAGTMQQAKTTAQIEPYTAAACLFSFPGISVPVAGNVGQFCILPKHTARAWLGAGLMIAGATIAVPAIVLVLVDVGLRAASAMGPVTTRAGRAVSFVNPAAGATLAAAGSAASSGRKPPRPKPAARRPAAPTETVTVEERTPISGEMGGTRRTVRTVRGPGVAAPARGRHARPESS